MTAISSPEQAYQYELRGHHEHTGWDNKDQSSMTVLTKEVEEERDAYSTGSIHWQPGVRARFPWLGFGALLTILVSIAMTIFIMKTSNGKNADQWPVYEKFDWIKKDWRTKAQLKPSVGLALTNTVSNLALAIAIAQGVTIAWWRKAMKGATVSELHSSWSFTTSVVDLITAGKGFNLIALAALTAKLALVDNLLLQQAAGDTPGLGNRSSVPVRVPINDTMPSDFLGTWSPDGLVGSLSFLFSLALIDVSTYGDIIPSTYDPDSFDNFCKGLCYTQVPGFGFNISCTMDPTPSTNYSVTPEMAINTTEAWRNGDIVDTDKTLLSLLSVTAYQRLVGETNSTARWSSIRLHTSWADLHPASGPVDNMDAESCTGRILSQTCDFRPAKVLYPIEITNQERFNDATAVNGYRLVHPWWIEVVPEESATNQADTYGILRNNQIAGVKVLETLPYDPAFDSNIQSYAAYMQAMFGGDISLQYLNGTGYVPAGGGLSSSSIGTWWAPITTLQANPNQKSCVIGTGNPAGYVMSQGDEQHVRGGLEENKSPKTTTLPYLRDVNAMNYYPTVIYVSNWGFLWGAIASLLFCVLCVLPSYWGFWQLGRKVTLGPMEIASAFQAPVLNHPAVASGGEVAVLLKEVGTRQVKYGEVQVEGSGLRLGVAEPGAVKRLPK